MLCELRVRCRLTFLTAIGILSPLFASESKLVIQGSNTFGEALGPALIRAYKQTRSATIIELESRGSATGIAALIDGTCDIAAVSRPLTEDEQRLAKSRGLKLKSYAIGYYGVAVIVNATNPIVRLSDEQVRDIFTGKISRWKAVGGPDAAVEVFTRETSTGTYLGFQELAMERRPYTPAATAVRTDQELAAAVAAHPNAIGYVPFASLERSGVKGVAINLFTPTAWNVVQNDYPFARGLRLCTDARRESEIAKAFVRFCLSREGQTLVGAAGFVGASQTPMLPALEP